MLKAKTLAKVSLFVFLAILLALVITVVIHLPSMKVIAQWKQPAEITYDGWGPYYVSVVESDLDWRGLPFLHVERNYFIYVGRDEGKPSYGHMIKYSFHAGGEDTQQFLKAANASWTADGVTLELPSGHRLFVPKKMFTGGR